MAYIDGPAHDILRRIKDAIAALHAADAGMLKLDQARDAAQALEPLVEKIFDDEEA
jgi:hypothetical protein